MSETEAAAPPDGVTAGTLLRQAREAAGLHVSSLAAHLKVPVRKLEALEEDRYEELPDAVFVRALASSVCRTLKVDPAPVLQRLPENPQPRLARMTQGINAPFRAPSDGPPPGLLNQVTRPVVLTVVALLLAALVLIFLPLAQRGIDTVVEANRPGAAAPPAVDAASEAPAPAAAPPQEDATSLPAPPASAAGLAAPAVTTAPVQPAAPAGTNGMELRTSAGPGSAVQPASEAGVAASAAAAASGPASARGIVVFRARGPSWVQVRDASGATVLQRLMEPGETAGASGALPLSVVVGSAESTEVQVRGRPLDLAPLARDNVARFEVK